jgi:hypothetical protein
VLPRVVSPSLTAKYEEGFFGSAFSHSNYGHKLTRHPGNHLGLWREMQPRKGEFLVFGERYLQPYEPKRTVTDFLKGSNDHY